MVTAKDVGDGLAILSALYSSFELARYIGVYLEYYKTGVLAAKTTDPQLRQQLQAKLAKLTPPAPLDTRTGLILELSAVLFGPSWYFTNGLYHGLKGAKLL